MIYSLTRGIDIEGLEEGGTPPGSLSDVVVK